MHVSVSAASLASVDTHRVCLVCAPLCNTCAGGSFCSLEQQQASSKTPADETAWVQTQGIWLPLPVCNLPFAKMNFNQNSIFSSWNWKLCILWQSLHKVWYKEFSLLALETVNRVIIFGRANTQRAKHRSVSSSLKLCTMPLTNAFRAQETNQREVFCFSTVSKIVLYFLLN